MITSRKAVQATPPFEYVIHTASPFHNNFDDPVRGLLEPAINGTTGILRAIKAFAPQVKRVVVTSSFAAIVNTASPPRVYDETSWNPVSWEEAVTQRSLAYRGSKVLTLFSTNLFKSSNLSVSATITDIPHQ